MSTSNAQAQWNGKIKDGSGTMKFTGYEGAYTFASRFEGDKGTNPEELIGAAHAGCYSMYLSLLLTEAGLTPESINTTAIVTIGIGIHNEREMPGFKIVCRRNCQNSSRCPFN